MRALLGLAVVVLILALIGWVTFGRDNKPGILLETDKIKEDTRDALESGSELLKKAEEKIEQLGTGTERPVDKSTDRYRPYTVDPIATAAERAAGIFTIAANSLSPVRGCRALAAAAA